MSDSTEIDYEANLLDTDDPIKDSDVPAGDGTQGFPNDQTESWLRGRSWPYVDADGDPVDTAAGMSELYPQVDLRKAIDLPVGGAMPAKLKAEIRSWGDDPDFDKDGTWHGGQTAT